MNETDKKGLGSFLNEKYKKFTGTTIKKSTKSLQFFIALIFIAFLVIYYLLPLLNFLFPENYQDQSATVSQAVSGIDGSNIQVALNGDGNDVDIVLPPSSYQATINGNENFFEEGEWFISSLTALDLKDGIIGLVDEFKAVRFEYSLDANQSVGYMLDFVPYGNYAMYVEVSRRDSYRLVFGQDDYKTLRLYVYSSKLQQWVKVDESTQSSDRPQFLNCVFEKGDTVRAEVYEARLIGVKKIRLTIHVFCDSMYDEFQYEFTEQPNFSELDDLYIAIFDYELDNDTKVYMNQPPVIKKLKE